MNATATASASASASASATLLLPPTPRDFEIHRLNRVEHASTYALARRFKISQTRVRQLVHRVGMWLASMLPARSDIEKEQEARLAQCLAADQLQSQAEKLQVFWEQTHDPKFLRQQTRVSLALARLGVVPGAIDAAAGDSIGEELEAWDEGPLVGDCSPFAAPAPDQAAEEPSGSDATAEGTDTYGDAKSKESDDPEGLKLLERRLLIVLDGMPVGDVERRRGLEKTLANIRREQAIVELRLSPDREAAQASCELEKPRGTPVKL